MCQKCSQIRYFHREKLKKKIRGRGHSPPSSTDPTPTVERKIPYLGPTLLGSYVASIPRDLDAFGVLAPQCKKFCGRPCRCHRRKKHTTGCSKKTDPLGYFDDNFSKYGPILIIFSLLQQDIHDTQKLSYFSHLTFIMMPLYLAKQTLILVSVLHVCFNELNGPQSDIKSN